MHDAFETKVVKPPDSWISKVHSEVGQQSLAGPAHGPIDRNLQHATAEGPVIRLGHSEE
jgi:hypothetical protein